MRTEKTYSYKHEEIIPFLQSIARFQTDHPTHKLRSAKEAQATATATGVLAEEVEYSQPWYSAKAKTLFLEKGIQLPPCTQVCLLRYRGEPPIRYAEHGIYRKKNRDTTEEDIFPIVFEPSVMSLIQSEPEYLALKQNARELCRLLSEKYHVPTKDRLRQLILEFDTFCASRASNAPMVAVPDITGQPMPPVVPPQGYTKTQMAELFGKSLSQNAEIIEAVQAMVSFSKHCVLLLWLTASSNPIYCLLHCSKTANNATVAANDQQVAANLAQVTANGARILDQNDRNGAFLRAAYGQNNQMLTALFPQGPPVDPVIGGAPQLGGAQVPQERGLAGPAPTRAPLRPANLFPQGTANAAAETVVEGMRNLNMENAPVPATPQRAPRAQEPTSTVRKSARARREPERLEPRI